MPAPPRTHSQWVVGPGSPPRGRAVGGARAPDPGRPTPRQEAPPPGTLMPPLQHTRLRAAGLVTGPHARTPPAPTARGYWAPAARPEGGQSGVGERPTPDAPHPGKRRPPPGTLMPPPQHARARAVGSVTGPHAGTPPAPTARGYWAPAARPEGGQSGVGERPTPDARHPGKERPPRASSCRPHSAQSQLARARAVGLVTGPDARTPPHPQAMGSGPRQPAQRAGSRGWESARPRTPHTQARGAPPGHPHAAPAARKSARCGVGDGSPRPQPPRTHSQRVLGPGSPPRGRAVGNGRAPDPGRSTPRQEAPPGGTLMPPPQHA